MEKKRSILVEVHHLLICFSLMCLLIWVICILKSGNDPIRSNTVASFIFSWRASIVLGFSVFIFSLLRKYGRKERLNLKIMMYLGFYAVSLFFIQAWIERYRETVQWFFQFNPHDIIEVSQEPSLESEAMFDDETIVRAPQEPQAPQAPLNIGTPATQASHEEINVEVRAPEFDGFAFEECVIFEDGIILKEIPGCSAKLAEYRDSVRFVVNVDSSFRTIRKYTINGADHDIYDTARDVKVSVVYWPNKKIIRVFQVTGNELPDRSGQKVGVSGTWSACGKVPWHEIVSVLKEPLPLTVHTAGQTSSADSSTDSPAQVISEPARSAPAYPNEW